MKISNSEINTVYTAYNSQLNNSAKTLSASVAYKIFKNIKMIEPYYTKLIHELNELQIKFANSGETTEAEYNKEYTRLMEETVDIDFDLIALSEIANELSIPEMEAIYIMINENA